MNLYSISQLQQFSGIKAHTIRIWEQRYNALKPYRSEGNVRYYDNIQLRRLLNIVSLMDGDHKVSELCSMNDDDLSTLLSTTIDNQIHTDEKSLGYVNQLIAAGVTYDEAYFEKIFSGCILRMGIKDTYVKVVYPMLTKLGLMWAGGTLPPAQEHFITNIIKQKLHTAIDSLPPVKSSEQSWLLFLPENEFHEIGLLFAHFIIRHSGNKVIYLGANVPFETLSDAIEETRISHLLFFMVHYNDPSETQLFIDNMKKHFSNIKLHVSGNQHLISMIKAGKELQHIASVNDLETKLYSKNNV